MNVAEWPLYFYRGDVLRVIDGDTVWIRVSLGMRTYRETSVRIAGIDAPELRSGTDAERAAGASARDYLAGLLPVETTVYARTDRDAQSFDRYVADLYLPDADGGLVDVAALLVDNGFAERSEG